MPHEKSIIHTVGHILYAILYCLLLLFSILFYNSSNLASLYAGWITLAFGIIILLSSSQSRKKSKEKGREILVKSGMYAYVRHPEFLGHLLIISALILISQHLFSMVFGITLIVLLYLATIGGGENEHRKVWLCI